MKKILLAASAVLVLTGCTKTNQMICIKDESTSGVKNRNTVVYRYNDQKIVKLEYTMQNEIEDFDQINAEGFSQYTTTLDEMLGEIRNNPGIIFKSEKTGNKYKASLSATTQGLESLGGYLDLNIKSIEEAKEDLEIAKYSCK